MQKPFRETDAFDEAVFDMVIRILQDHIQKPRIEQRFQNQLPAKCDELEISAVQETYQRIMGKA